MLLFPGMTYVSQRLLAHSAKAVCWPSLELEAITSNDDKHYTVYVTGVVTVSFARYGVISLGIGIAVLFLYSFTSPSTLPPGSVLYLCCPLSFFLFFPSLLVFVSIFLSWLSFSLSFVLAFDFSVSYSLRETDSPFSVVTVDVIFSRIHLRQYKFVSCC
jgi:hypothetical protein